MIITLRIECVSGCYLEDECIRVVEINDTASLDCLHEVIQDAVDFGRDHPFAFYTANSSSPWAQKNYLLDSDDLERGHAKWIDIHLVDIFPLGRRKLYYLFDFGDKWLFEVRKSRGSKAPVAGVEYPRVVEAIGPNPQQYPSAEDWV